MCVAASRVDETFAVGIVHNSAVKLRSLNEHTAVLLMRFALIVVRVSVRHNSSANTAHTTMAAVATARCMMTTAN